MPRVVERALRWMILVPALALCAACADGTPLPGGDASTGGIPPPPPPDKPGTPPAGPDPDRPNEPPPDQPEAEPPPEEGQPTDDCMGIDFLGVCHGTLAVWCEADEGQLYAYDCADEGLVCDYIDEDIGYYCVPDRAGGPPEDQPPEREPDPPPEREPDPAPDLPPEDQPPEQPAEPADPCPGVDWFGRCDGNVAVWCDDEEEILQFDCSWIGMICQDLGIFGHRCVAPDQNQSPPQNPSSPGG